MTKVGLDDRALLTAYKHPTPSHLLLYIYQRYCRRACASIAARREQTKASGVGVVGRFTKPRRAISACVPGLTQAMEIQASPIPRSKKYSKNEFFIKTINAYLVFNLLIPSLCTRCKCLCCVHTLAAPPHIMLTCAQKILLLLCGVRGLSIPL